MKGGTDGFTIAVTEAGSTRLLALSGEFDLAGVELFERSLHSPAAGDAAVLDVRGLTFIDSSGLRALIQADLRYREQGARVVVVKTGGQVEDVLELTGLGDRLELVDEIPPELAPGLPV